MEGIFFVVVVVVALTHGGDGPPVGQEQPAAARENAGSETHDLLEEGL